MKSNRRLRCGYGLLCAMAFLPLLALAQPPATAPSPALGPRYLAAQVPRPSNRDTTRALAAAVEYAKQKGVSISCAVVDGRGDLVGFTRMDSADFKSRRIAEAKTLTSALLGIPSGDAARSGALFDGLNALMQNTMLAVRGAVPIIRNNEVTGAIGCSGAPGPGDVDEAAATAGLAAMSLH